MKKIKITKNGLWTVAHISIGMATLTLPVAWLAVSVTRVPVDIIKERIFDSIDIWTEKGSLCEEPNHYGINKKPHKLLEISGTPGDFCAKEYIFIDSSGLEVTEIWAITSFEYLNAKISFDSFEVERVKDINKINKDNMHLQFLVNSQNLINELYLHQAY